MRRALLGPLLYMSLIACDGPSVPDAGCGMTGVAPDQPALSCPEMVDLGCIGTEGATLSIDTQVATCDGSEATVVCTPANGSTFVPGSAASGRCVATAPSGASAECTFTVRYAVDQPNALQCAAAIERACEAPLTAVTIDAPDVRQSCTDGAIGAVSSDAPSEGFAVGDHVVRYDAPVEGGAALSCTVEVRITDATPPTLSCDDARVLRAQRGDPIDPAPPSATDACDDDVTLTIGALPTDRGVATVAVSAADDAGGTSTCDWQITVLDVWPPSDLRIVSAERAGDGTTDLTLGWSDDYGDDVTELRLERATDLAGAWTALGTVAVGTQTYTDAEMPSPVAYYRLVALAGTDEGGATDPVRALSVEADEYHSMGQSVPGVGFATALRAVVRYPTDLTSGPYPFVLFMHGNHGNCRPSSGDDQCQTRTEDDCTSTGRTTTPNMAGYVYLQETLSAQGYVTASVSANALNCRNDFIPERTALILEHLRRWVTWSTTGGAPFGTTFAGAVDLSRVSLVGHSRGGEAVSGTPAALQASPIAGVSLASVFAIGPTDYHDQAPRDLPFAVLLPGCDGDVATLEGMRQYDRGLIPASATPRAQVLYIGANHNFFNTEWRFDDNAEIARSCSNANLVGGPAQRGMLEIVLSDWLRAANDGVLVPDYQRTMLPSSPPLLNAWAGRSLDLRWSYAAGGRRIVDDFAGTGAPNTNELGGANTYAGMIAALSCTGGCRGNFNHVTGAVRTAWQDAPASVTMALGDLDASAYPAVSMRFASRLATINDGITEHDFVIRVRDAAGTSAEVPLTEVGRLPHGYPSNFALEVLTTLRVPFTAMLARAPGLDVAHLTSLEVEWPGAGSAQGSIWMADVDLSD
ncbi:MAG: hypothetical protein AB7S26_10590 [Sandaracinaceae bacterium]